MANVGSRDSQQRIGSTGPQCFSCHRKNGNGRDFGPDLSKVGEKYTKELLLLHIADPNKFVDNPWKARSIDTQDDESYTGFIGKQDDKTIILKTAIGTEIARSRIASNTGLTTSLMPEGTIDSLTPQETADLLEFLPN